MMMPRNEPIENDRNLKTFKSTSGCLSRSVFMTKSDQRDDGDDREEDDRLRLEPVVALALLEHELQRSEPGGQQAEADPVDAALGLRDVLRIRDERERHQERDDADRNVDVEDQRPAGVVDDPTAERRADRGSDHRAHAEDRHRGAAPLRRKRLEENRLRRRLQRAAADALE